MRKVFVDPELSLVALDWNLPPARVRDQDVHGVVCPETPVGNSHFVGPPPIVGDSNESKDFTSATLLQSLVPPLSAEDGLGIADFRK